MDWDRIVCDDCVRGLSTLPSDVAQLSFADPPFNLGKVYSSSADDLHDDEYRTWCRRWLTALVRVTSPTGWIAVHHIPKWLIPIGEMLTSLGCTFKHWVAWKAGTVPMPKPLEPDHYGILLYSKTSQPTFHRLRQPHPRCPHGHLMIDYGGKLSTIHPFGPIIGDVWTDIPRIRWKTHRDDHPCQLPRPLLERLVLLTSDAGDLVVDPFVGTGTTMVAAQRLGRHYWGTELDPDYDRIAFESIRTPVVSRIGRHYVGYDLTGQRVMTIRNDDWDDLQKYCVIPKTPKELEKKAVRWVKQRTDSLTRFF